MSQRLRDYSVRNGLEGRLQVVHAAVWSRTASDGLSFRRGTTARSQGGIEADGNHPVLARGEIINVPAITLDDFVAAGGPPPQMVKIDVEGGEYEVLRGTTALFATQLAAYHRRSPPPTGRRANHHLAERTPIRGAVEHTGRKVSATPVCLAHGTRW